MFIRRIVRARNRLLNLFGPTKLPSRESFVAYVTWCRSTSVTATPFLESRNGKVDVGATFKARTESDRSIIWKCTWGTWEDISFQGRSAQKERSPARLTVLTVGPRLPQLYAEKELARIRTEVIDSGKGAASLTTAILYSEDMRRDARRLYPTTDNVFGE